MSTPTASSASEPPSDGGSHQDEAVLLRRVAQGDARASRAVVEQHLAGLTRFAWRMLSDQAEAEDVAQETFLRLWRQARRWEPRAKLSTWLYRVAHNLCIDRLRVRRTRTQARPPEPEPPEPPAALLARRERSQAVQRALGELAERQRAAIVLVYYEGLSNAEAAKVMDVHIDALESLLARARRRLRQLLQRDHAPNGGVT